MSFVLDLTESAQTKRIPQAPCSFEFNELPKANANLPEGQRYPAFVATGKWFDTVGNGHDAVFAISTNLATMANRVGEKMLNVRLKLENNKITPAA